MLLKRKTRKNQLNASAAGDVKAKEPPTQTRSCAPTAKPGTPNQLRGSQGCTSNQGRAALPDQQGLDVANILEGWKTSPPSRTILVSQNLWRNDRGRSDTSHES